MVATDTAALQAWADDVPDGGIGYFAPYEYQVNEILGLDAEKRWVGTVDRVGTGARIKMASGSNKDATVASKSWLNASTTPSAGEPMWIEHLYIDSNKAGNPTGQNLGLAYMNFQSIISSVTTNNTRGDGIRATSQTRDGFNISDGQFTCNEVKIYDCNAWNSDAIGIHVHEGTNVAAMTDGWIVNCKTATCAKSGIVVDGTAGWVILGNHTYGSGESGIKASRAYRSKVALNYCESFGRSATPGTYAGILFTQISGAPNHVIDNTIIASAGGGTIHTDTLLRGIWGRTESGETAYVTVADNQIHQTAAADQPTIAIQISNQDTESVTILTEGLNTASGWDTVVSTSTTVGTMRTVSGLANGQPRIIATAFSATPTIFPSLVAVCHNTWRMPLTANVTALTIGAGVDGQRMTLQFIEDATGGWTVSWPANVVDPPTINRAPNKVTNVVLFYVEATALWYVEQIDRQQMFVQFHTPVGGAGTLTAQASALQFMLNTNRMQIPADLTHFRQVKFSVRVTTLSASANNPRIILRYFPTFSTASGDYLDIAAAELSASLAATGMIESAWVDLASGARAPVTLALLAIGGDATAAPAVSSVTAQFR